jgi:Na+-transporting NADH:ubiquinone oxidoreductase subunit B
VSRLEPIREMFASFVRSPGATTGPTGPHVRDVNDLKRTMFVVIVALLPCLGFAIYSYGLARIAPILAVSYGVGLGIEMLFAVIRQKPVSEGYLVTGLLIALIVPITIPLWQLATGVAFAVIFGKEVFGGTGKNIFNPALVCRAFLFFAYPAQMSGEVWIEPPPAAATLAGAVESVDAVDAVSGATPLAIAAAAPADANAALDAAGYTTRALVLGDVAGTPGELHKLAILVGAIILVAGGVASLRTMVAGVAGLVATALIVWLAMPDATGIAGLAPWRHLVVGGFLFAIVFMATDPVTSPETAAGKWVFGAACGALTVLIRVFSPAYPEGAMLAILLMNAFAPAIDRGVLAVHVRRRRARRGG